MLVEVEMGLLREGRIVYVDPGVQFLMAVKMHFDAIDKSDGYKFTANVLKAMSALKAQHGVVLSIAQEWLIALHRNYQINVLMGISTDPISSQSIRPEKCGLVGELATLQLDLSAAHTRPVFGLAYSPCGKLLASTGADRAVQVWELTTGIRRHKYVHEGWVYHVVFSPSGEFLASASADGTASLLQVATGERTSLRHCVTGQHVVRGVAFSPDSRLLLSAGLGVVMVWDVAHFRSPKCVQTLAKHKGQVNTVAFSSDGETFASGGRDGEVHLWDLRREELTSGGVILSPLCNFAISPHQGQPVYRGAFTPGGGLLASVGGDHRIVLTDRMTGIFVRAIQDDCSLLRGAPPPTPVRPSISGAAASPTSGGAPSVLPQQDRSTIQPELLGHEDAIFDLAFSPDGSVIATVGGRDKQVIFWEVCSGRILARRHYPLVTDDSRHEAGCYAVTFSPHGGQCAVGTTGGPITLLAVRADCLRDGARRHRSVVTSGSLRFDGAVVATSGEDSQIVLWDVASGRVLQTFDLRGRAEVTALCFSPSSGDLISGAADGTIAVWKTIGRRGFLRTCQSPILPEKLRGSRIDQISFTPDGSAVVAVVRGPAEGVTFWNPLDGSMIQSLLVSPDMVLSRLNCGVNILAEPSGPTSLMRMESSDGRRKHRLRLVDFNSVAVVTVGQVSWSFPLVRAEVSSSPN
jgi:WD40 repeat protein